MALLLTLVVCTGLSAMAEDSGFLSSPHAYLGQIPPDDVPTLFAPGIVSVSGRNEATITFSPDGTSCLFHIEAYPDSYTLFTEYTNGQWTEPTRAWFSETRPAGEPSFSPDGNKIYFASGETRKSHGGWDLWYVERNGNGWSEPVNLGSPVNSPGDEFHPSIVGDGSLYFTDANGNINRCQWAEGKFEARVVLPEPINLKDKSNGVSWGDAWVASDESVMIFKSNRKGGYGSYDNYISHRNADGTWSDPENLGAKINSKGRETAGDMSPDGKYLFFGRDGDIYWVPRRNSR
jgi:Tol biopolymer transport system component